MYFEYWHCDLFLFFSLVPTAAAAKLGDAFGKLGTAATGAKNGLLKLKNKWSETAAGDRAKVVSALQSAASNIDKFANAGVDPVGTIHAGLNTVAQFAALAGPEGQIASVTLTFVSGFLSLFGVGGEQKSVGEIVKEQIDEALDKYYSVELKNVAEGTINTLETSKSYVDNLAQKGVTLTVDEATVVQINVPLWLGLRFMGTLASEIQSLLKANKEDDAAKVLMYIELYTRMAVLKDIIIQETAALFPDELAPNRESMLKTQNNLRNAQKIFLKFLYESDVGTFAIPYFDPDVYPITDAYLSVVLQVPNYDRSLAGIWCLTPLLKERKFPPITFSAFDPSLSLEAPYITIGAEECFWKLVPHGKNLFSIVDFYWQLNITKGIPSNIPRPPIPWYISYGYDLACVTGKAMLWEIEGSSEKRCVLMWAVTCLSVLSQEGGALLGYCVKVCC